MTGPASVVRNMVDRPYFSTGESRFGKKFVHDIPVTMKIRFERAKRRIICRKAAVNFQDGKDVGGEGERWGTVEGEREKKGQVRESDSSQVCDVFGAWGLNYRTVDEKCILKGIWTQDCLAKPSTWLLCQIRSQHNILHLELCTNLPEPF